MKANEKMEKRPFGMRDKIGYLFGNFGNDFTFQFASSYLLVFYTKVLGISGAIIGTLFLIARCIDGFTDVTMGHICDHSKNGKNGKFRPWIKRFSIPVVLASILMYNHYVADWSMTAKIIYVSITYLIWGSICYTGVNIPYGSMASVITGDATQRASLSTFRTIGSVLAGVGIGVATPQLVYVQDASGTIIASGERFFLVAIIFGILALLCYVIFYKCTHERVELPQVQKNIDYSIKEDLKFLCKDKSFVSIMVVTLLTLIASQIGMTLNQYLFLDYFGNPGLISAVLLIQTAGMFLAAPFVGKLTSKFGKKEAGAVSLGFVATFYLGIYLFKVDNIAVFMALLFVANIALGYFSLVSWAYLNDVIDHYQIKTGKRKDGTVFAVSSFIRKLGQAFAGAIGGWTLTLIGYNSEAVVQTVEVKNHIFAVCLGVPAVCYVLSAILLFVIYPLTKEKVTENQEIILNVE